MASGYGYGCRALLVSGACGAGKTVVAQLAGRLLTGAGYATALIDADALSQFGPAPDRSAAGRSDFYTRLRCQNLAAVWQNYSAVGARFAVVSGQIDNAALRRSYEAALQDCDVQVVRLVVPVDTLHQRIRTRARTIGTTIEAQLLSAVMSHEALERARIEDFTVSNDRHLEQVASEVLKRAGWPHVGQL